MVGNSWVTCSKVNSLLLPPLGMPLELLYKYIASQIAIIVLVHIYFYYLFSLKVYSRTIHEYKWHVCSIRMLYMCMYILYFRAKLQDFTYYSYMLKLCSTYSYLCSVVLKWQTYEYQQFYSSSKISSTQLAIMLALCSMLLPPYYSQNYAGIIISSLVVARYC